METWTANNTRCVCVRGQQLRRWRPTEMWLVCLSVCLFAASTRRFVRRSVKPYASTIARSRARKQYNLLWINTHNVLPPLLHYTLLFTRASLSSHHPEWLHGLDIVSAAVADNAPAHLLYNVFLKYTNIFYILLQCIVHYSRLRAVSGIL